MALIVYGLDVIRAAAHVREIRHGANSVKQLKDLQKYQPQRKRRRAPSCNFNNYRMFNA
jgi:hypothetical protein